MRVLSPVMLFVMLLALPAFADQPFWHAGNARVELWVDSSRLLVKFDEPVSDAELDAFVAANDNIEAVIRDEWQSPYFVVCALRNAGDFDGLSETVSRANGVSRVEPYYRSRSGQPRIVTGGIFVKFEPEVTKREVDSINSVFGVTVDYVVSGPGNSYRISNSVECPLSDVDLANTYHALKQTVYAHPDFLLPVVASGYQVYDYYVEYQWHIRKITGDFESATVWDFARVDSAITVAVVDQGVAPHEDLPESRLVDGWDFGEDREGGLPYLNYFHGQACAGLIAASHCTDSQDTGDRNTGIISMAPNVNIMPIKIWRDDGGFGPVTKYASAINYAWENGADVISNSWGLNPMYWDDPPTPGLTTAFYNAVTYGRDGLGCAIIFAAGNEGVAYDTVPFPQNCEYNLVVGAVRQDDSLWSYSNYDPNDTLVDLVAPSGGQGQDGDVWTLDIMDTLGANRPTPTKAMPGDEDSIYYDCPSGDNDLDYNCHFSGTSAACPMVAGAAALLLSRDPTLPRSRVVAGGGGVYEILRGSAVKNLDWGSITPPDYRYGYGRVDAYRAILSIARGDANNDGDVTLGDISLLIDHEFGAGAPIVLDSLLGDVNCDGDVSLGDISVLIDHLFITQAPLPLPCFVFND